MLRTEPYELQRTRWPRQGRHILAQFDASTIVVYQAYSEAIGGFAATHGWFGGDFSYERWSWIKPGFLWMMFRSGWATKRDQTVVLAVHLPREAFDHVLATTVHSVFLPAVYGTETSWKKQIRGSDVRLQWDPDHNPRGAKIARRAIQLGLRGETLRRYGREWIVRIDDITGFVAEQRQHVEAARLDMLVTPSETVYPVPETLAQHLGTTEPRIEP